MQTIKTILLLLTFTLTTYANIPPQTTITKTYDALNRLKTVTDAQGTVTYTYDAIGRQTQVSYSNGITTSYEYDSRNRITRIEHKKSDGTVLQSFAYTLDAVGNRTKIVEHTGRTTNYAYNNVNQLTKETITNDPNGNNTTTTFTYDAVGNMLTQTIDGVDTRYEYNDNDQLTQKGSITFTYDANGNLVQKDSTTYEYDDKNRLIKTMTPNNTIEYSYDANDNRVAKTTNQGTTTYLIDANTPYAQVITESKEDGTEVNYTYGNDLLSDGTHSFLSDALGSTRGLVDNTEALTDSYAYTPYGELSSHDGNATNSFLFTGEQFDAETDDYYLRARYYSPSAGRFISRDSYDGRDYEPATLNHYGYTHGNPVNYTDPSGHFTVASLGFSMSISSTLRTANQSKSIQILRGLMNAAVDVDGKGAKGFLIDIIQDLAINAVMSTMIGTHHSKTTAGTAAHHKFQKLLEEQFKKPISWLGFDVHILPEVFVDKGGLKVRRRSRGSLGVDILISTGPKGVAPNKDHSNL